jgi:hypothetical protein
MEVVMSAAVLVLVVLGVLAAMDAVSGTAGANQARTVAAALAEEDQERLRGFATEDLDRLETLQPAPRQVKVGSVTYTVASKAEWISDASGQEASCALPTGDGNYMRITSTVTSPATGARMPPLVLTSIVAPQPGEGTLAAKVVNAAGQPVQNLPVTATGPETRPSVTNEVGCAVFGQLTAGSYQVEVNQSGWVDKDGNQQVIKSATVSSGNLTTVEFRYDRTASMNVEFHTVYNRGAGAVTADETSTGAMLVHTGMQIGYRLVPATEGAAAAVYAVGNLFPFTDPYKVYSGRCAGNDPSEFIDTYFDSFPDDAPTLGPGTPAGTIDVLEPALDPRVRWNGSLASGANVYAYPKTSGCSTARISLGQTNSSGRIANPGLPFGVYDMCVDHRVGSGGSNPRRRITLTNLSNSNLDGTQLAFDFLTSGTPTPAGTCP